MKADDSASKSLFSNRTLLTILITNLLSIVVGAGIGYVVGNLTIRLIVLINFSHFLEFGCARNPVLDINSSSHQSIHEPLYIALFTNLDTHAQKKF